MTEFVIYLLAIVFIVDYIFVCYCVGYVLDLFLDSRYPTLCGILSTLWPITLFLALPVCVISIIVKCFAILWIRIFK